MLNYLTYNGTKSTDLGVYVTGSGSFDAAEKDADKYEIAGRNGDLIIPKNRYKNIVVTYPAFIPKAFQEKAQSIRNWMRSAKAYARLEDTYDMEHYRIGLASGIQSFEPVNRNDASNFQLSFDCKPQRFLKTGETPLPIQPEAHSYSGEIVEFETVAVDDMTKAEVSLSPIQSLNGYDHPWAGGAGKNKFPYPVERDVTYSNVHFVSDGKGKITITGTASGNNDATFALTDYFVIPDGSQYEVCFLNTEGNGIVQFLKDATVLDNWTLSSAYRHSSYVGMSNKECNRVKFLVTQGKTYNQTLQIMFLLSSDVTNTYIPYSNLCPISGHTEATLNVSGKNLLDASSLAFTSGLRNDSGAQATSSNSHYSSEISVKGNTTYTLSGLLMITGTAYRVYFLTNTKGWISRTDQLSSESYTFTTNAECGYIQIQCANTIDLTEAMLELGSTATDYVPYDGSQYTATFGQTVYGGTFDFVSGKLVVTHRGIDISTISGWSKYANVDGTVQINISGLGMSVPTYTGIPSADSIICSHFKNNSRSAIAGKTDVGVGIGSATIVVFYAGEYSATVSDWTTYLTAQHNAGTPVMIVAKLATPIEIDLTPTQVQTLLGQNNVWASDGTVEINYADPFNVENPTYFEARPLFEITNPAQNDVLNVNGKIITFLSSYTGTVTIDCETMNAYAGLTNMNYLISATDFPILTEGTNIVTWSGDGECKMVPRWWEL